MTVNATHSYNGDADGSVKKITWESVTTADHTGYGVAFLEYGDKSIQAVSASWGGATIIVEGSNDGGTTYAQLHDSAGNLISMTANGLVKIDEDVDLIRPRLSVVGVGADIDVYLVGRRTTNQRTN